MRRLIGITTAMGILLLAAAAAYAHGGSYPGPGGAGSGGPGGPGGAGRSGGGFPGGGGDSGGGGQPGGQGGHSGGGGGGNAGPVPTSPGGGPGHVGGGTSGGGRRKKSSGDAGLSWAHWWFHNDDRFLNLKARVRRTNAETANADLFMGESEDIAALVGIPLEKIRGEVVPALAYTIKDPHYDARAAAAIALGKCAEPGFRAEIATLLADPDKRVRESACLALGILGNKEAIPLLIDVARDAPAAREALGRSKGVYTRTRAFAALAIGLIGTRQDISDSRGEPALIEMIRQRSAHADLSVAPIVALGLMKSRGGVPILLEIATDSRTSALVRSYACTSLGKIGDRAALPTLGKLLRDKHSAVKQSSAIALGLLAQENDKAIVNALHKHVKSSPDRATRNFGILALGEIGGKASRNLLFTMLRRSSPIDRTFAALALGIWGFKNDDPEEPVIAAELLRQFDASRSPETRGAFAVALGLMKHGPAGPKLVEALAKGGPADLRGHLCTALGLLEYRPAIKPVQEVVRERGDVGLRRNAAIALGLLGDRAAAEVLEDEIERSSNSLAVHGAVTQGLGFIGDIRSTTILCGMVKDRVGYKDATRAFAAVALGLLADKDDLPVLSGISQNNNYLARTEAITEVITIL